MKNALENHSPEVFPEFVPSFLIQLPGKTSPKWRDICYEK